MREQATAAIREFEKAPAIKGDQVNLMQAILRSGLAPSEKTRNRMAQEMFSILTASGDTIGRTLTMAVYHLLANPHHLGKLREELASVMPGPNDEVELQQLESLPWLVSFAQVYDSRYLILVRTWLLMMSVYLRPRLSKSPCEFQL